MVYSLPFRFKSVAAGLAPGREAPWLPQLPARSQEMRMPRKDLLDSPRTGLEEDFWQLGKCQQSSGACEMGSHPPNGAISLTCGRRMRLSTDRYLWLFIKAHAGFQAPSDLFTCTSYTFQRPPTGLSWLPHSFCLSYPPPRCPEQPIITARFPLCLATLFSLLFSFLLFSAILLLLSLPKG